jgi:hypothetical protein
MPLAIYMLYLNAINTPNNFDQEDFQKKTGMSSGDPEEWQTLLH